MESFECFQDFPGWFVTIPETNIAPENGWLEDEFPFGARPVFRDYVSFREGIIHFKKLGYLMMLIVGVYFATHLLEYMF